MFGRKPVDSLADRLRSGSHGTILFLSDRGAARAMIAAAIVNRHCASGFTAVSAGLTPPEAPHPLALELMRAYKLPFSKARPRTLEEMSAEGAPRVDYVIAIWDRSSGEPYPMAGRRPVAASWDVADPRRAVETGAGVIDSRLAFVRVYQSLKNRIADFVEAVDEERRRVGGRAPGWINGEPAIDRRRPAAPKGRRDHGEPLDLSASMLAPQAQSRP